MLMWRLHVTTPKGKPIYYVHWIPLDYHIEIDSKYQFGSLGTPPVTMLSIVTKIMMTHDMEHFSHVYLPVQSPNRMTEKCAI